MFVNIVLSAVNRLHMWTYIGWCRPQSNSLIMIIQGWSRSLHAQTVSDGPNPAGTKLIQFLSLKLARSWNWLFMFGIWDNEHVHATGDTHLSVDHWYDLISIIHPNSDGKAYNAYSNGYVSLHYTFYLWENLYSSMPVYNNYIGSIKLLLVFTMRSVWNLDDHNNFKNHQALCSHYFLNAQTRCNNYYYVYT